jgi:DNA end-binding protein Ku
MPRAIWTGTLSFGLVTIPVRMFNATEARDVRFHQLERETGRRIRYVRTTETEGFGADAWWSPPPETWSQERPEAGPTAVEDGGEEGSRPEAPATDWPSPGRAPGPGPVDYSDVVKGYEVAPDRFVTVSQEELRDLRPEATHTIDIEDFVDLADIDPVSFERSYVLAPQYGSEKPYALLLRAMEDAGQVGIGRFVLRTKEHLAAIRPRDGAIGLETLFYGDEVRPVEEFGNLPVRAEVSDREVAMARQLIDLLATEWDPTRYKDTYRERVMALIEGKVGEGDLVEEPEAAEPPRVADLMGALKASVEAARAEKRQTG